MEKIFDLYELKDVKVEDAGLRRVINLDVKLVVKSMGRQREKFGKAKVNIEMISQGASEINISFIVNDAEADKAVQALHSEYFK